MSETWREHLTPFFRHKGEMEIAAATSAITRAIELATEQMPGELPALYNAEAGLHLKCDDLDAAERAARRSLGSIREADNLDPERVATYHLMMARVHEVKKQLPEALRHMEIAVNLFEGKYNADYHYAKLLRQQMEALRSAT